MEDIKRIPAPFSGKIEIIMHETQNYNVVQKKKRVQKIAPGDRPKGK